MDDQAIADTQTASAPDKAERREFGFLYLRGRTWWMRYRIGGKEHRESSRSASRKQAEKLLNRRAAELDAGTLTAPSVRRVMFADLETILLTHFRKSGLRSLPRLKGALKHLGKAFGSMRAQSITADDISVYELDRLEAGAARATVNNELAALRRAFRLAIKARRLTSMPAISIPNPRNARSGYFEPADLAAVLDKLPEYLRPVVRFAYMTGWRVRSEVLPLTWDRIDFEAGIVHLDPNTTKNDKGRTFPFDALPALAALLRQQHGHTTALERSLGRIIPHVFHRNGRPIKSYNNAWRRACTQAATNGQKGELEVITRPQLLGRIMHDFRRTAVRNLVRAGVNELLAMQLTGHKTRAVFDRYNITNEADLKAGVEKLAEYLEPSKSRPRGRTKGTTGAQSPIRRIGRGGR